MINLKKWEKGDNCRLYFPNNCWIEKDRGMDDSTPCNFNIQFKGQGAMACENQRVRYAETMISGLGQLTFNDLCQMAK